MLAQRTTSTLSARRLAASCLLIASCHVGATPLTPEPSWTPTGAPTAAPQSGLSLEQLTHIVLTHNPELQAAQRARQTARAGVTTAGAWANPRLEWNTGRNTARLPGASDGRAQTWGVSQLLENPTVRNARIEAALAGERGSEHHVAITRNALVAQIRLGAYEALLRQAEAAAAQDAVTLLEQVRERVRLRVESGEAARYEIIKADAEIIHARQRQQTAALQAQQALLGLNRLAAGQLPARWTLTAALGDPLDLPGLEDIQELASIRNPELRALQADVDRQQAHLEGAKASRWPGVELKYSQSREPEMRQGLLGVSVQIPLLDQRTGPMAEAASELERARGRLQGRHAELQQEVLQAWKSLEMARLRATALSEGAVREAEAALRVAQAAYRFGERGILDVLDAQRVLRTVRADLLEARFQIQAARIQLEQLSGRYADAPQP